MNSSSSRAKGEGVMGLVQWAGWVVVAAREKSSATVTDMWRYQRAGVFDGKLVAS